MAILFPWICSAVNSGQFPSRLRCEFPDVRHRAALILRLYRVRHRCQEFFARRRDGQILIVLSAVKLFEGQMHFNGQIQLGNPAKLDLKTTLPSS